jgi:hypothetical protein
MLKRKVMTNLIILFLFYQGMKVVSGSLDVLESVGKKTFDVSIQKNNDQLFLLHISSITKGN